MMTPDDKVGGWVKKGQSHDDVILECPLIETRLGETISTFKLGAIQQLHGQEEGKGGGGPLTVHMDQNLKPIQLFQHYPVEDD